MPRGPFIALCKLSSARFSSHTGFARESRQTIYLLRSLLGCPNEGDAPSALIQSGIGQEYRLRIGAGALRMDASFSELSSPTLIDEGLKLELVARLGTPALHEASV